MKSLGFRVDDDKWLHEVQRALRRVGYTLHPPEWLDRFPTEYDFSVRPLGQGPRFVLRLSQDAYQDWAYGELLHELPDSQEHVLADIRFTSATRNAWLGQIVAGVRAAALACRDGCRICDPPAPDVASPELA